MCASTEIDVRESASDALSLAAKGSVVAEKRRTRCPFKRPFPHPENALYIYVTTWLQWQMMSKHSMTNVLIYHLGVFYNNFII
jgi:hypothetical protein